MADSSETTLICWFDDLTSEDVAIVGGKNASLGEMISVLKEKGVKVPDGFAITADAYRTFLKEGKLEEKIRDCLDAWQ